MLKYAMFIILLMFFTGCTLITPTAKKERKNLSFFHKLMNPWEADDWSPAAKTAAFIGPGH